jgi:hypothetical protein
VHTLHGDAPRAVNERARLRTLRLVDPRGRAVHRPLRDALQVTCSAARAIAVDSDGRALVLRGFISVEHCFHPDAGSVSYGTLIPNLAALEASDAVVLVGGRLTVKLIGEIALDKERPVLAIPSFGGTAAEIYEALKYAYKARLPAHYDKISLLRSVWRDDSAERALDIAELLADNETEVAAHSYFLSYRWANSSLADHVEVLLRRACRPVNRDESIFNVGINLSDLVQSLIDNSDTFIALWNSDYRESEWCPQELEHALRRQAAGKSPRRVVLLLLDDTEPPLRAVTRLHMSGRERTERELSIRRLVEQEIDAEGSPPP